ncbi:hypothetical protein C8R43DRAFT_1245431 [Mycena crocata]|nr:hypothetical protein C8R43DRAFT_1245431 [Mycena crocata]
MHADVDAFADPTIRNIVLGSLNEQFDRHLSQAENVRSLFIALNDEVYENRKTAAALIGRMAKHNPAIRLARAQYAGAVPRALARGVGPGGVGAVEGWAVGACSFSFRSFTFPCDLPTSVRPIQSNSIVDYFYWSRSRKHLAQPPHAKAPAAKAPTRRPLELPLYLGTRAQTSKTKHSTQGVTSEDAIFGSAKGGFPVPLAEVQYY